MLCYPLLWTMIFLVLLFLPPVEFYLIFFPIAREARMIFPGGVTELYTPLAQRLEICRTILNKVVANFYLCKGVKPQGIFLCVYKM